MAKKLTQHQLEIITDLYHAVSGQANVFVPADTIPHSPLYWLAHECRGLITMQKKKRKGKTYRKIALTDKGVIWCDGNGIYARDFTPSALMPLADKRKRVTIGFQLPVSDGLIGQVESCKNNKHFIPVIRLAMQLYGALGYTGFQALTESTLNNLDIYHMSPDEIAGLYAEIESERLRLELERGALEAQTLEVKQFHDMFRAIDKIDQKLERLGNTPRNAENGATQAAPIGLRAIGQQNAENAPKVDTAFKVEAPTFDDDDDDLFKVETDANAGKIANANFLRTVIELPDIKGKVDPSKLSARQKANMGLADTQPSDTKEIKVDWK